MGHHQNEGPSETGGRSLASRCLLLPRFWAVAYGKSSWSSAEEKHLQACERCRRYAERVTREAQASVLRAFFRDKVLVDPGDLPLADRDWAARTLTEPGMGYLCLTFIPGLCPGELWVAIQFVAHPDRDDECQIGQNRATIHAAGTLRQIFEEILAGDARYQVELTGRPAPRARIPLDLERSQQILAGTLSVENALQQVLRDQLHLSGSAGPSLGGPANPISTVGTLKPQPTQAPERSSPSPPSDAANPVPPSCPRLVFRGHGWEAGSGERAWPAPGEAGPASSRAPTPPRLGPWQLQSLQASRAGRLSSSGEHARQLALDLPPAAGRLVCTVYPDRRSEDEQRPYWAVTIALDSSAALSWLEVALQVGPATTGFRSLRAGEEETFEIEPPHDLPPRVHLEWECHGQQHTDQVELPLVDAR